MIVFAKINDKFHDFISKSACSDKNNRHLWEYWNYVTWYKWLRSLLWDKTVDFVFQTENSHLGHWKLGPLQTPVVFAIFYVSFTAFSALHFCVQTPGTTVHFLRQDFPLKWKFFLHEHELAVWLTVRSWRDYWHPRRLKKAVLLLNCANESDKGSGAFFFLSQPLCAKAKPSLKAFKLLD